MVTKEMCIGDVAGFDTFSSAKAMVLRRNPEGVLRLQSGGGVRSRAEHGTPARYVINKLKTPTG